MVPSVLGPDYIVPWSEYEYTSYDPTSQVFHTSPFAAGVGLSRTHRTAQMMPSHPAAVVAGGVKPVGGAIIAAKSDPDTGEEFVYVPDCDDGPLCFQRSARDSAPSSVV